MAKLTILAAALLSLLALSHASSAFRTTITTTVDDDDENPWQPFWQRCQEQMRQQQQLRECQNYLSRGGSYVAAMITTNKQNQQSQQQLRQCCEQLQNMDEECRCEGIKTVVRQQQQEQGGELRGMVQMAENLPDRCNLSPRRCQIRASWF